ncbi:MAG: hypothetical protein KKC03_13560 [Bacteroidetes bacterium]|nr:hypothetical protein [Bacteroidota bacterium]
MDKKIDASLAPTFADRAAHKPTRVVEIDVMRYQHLLDDPDLTDEQKRAFLEALWSIVIDFVDLGFGVHPMQEVTDSFNVLAKNDGAEDPDMLECKDQFNGNGTSDYSALDAE